MKYTDLDMQDVQSQPSVQVQSSDNGTLDHGIRRSRVSDTTNVNNSSSTKAPPEVIDLDEEDSPKASEEVSLPINGVTNIRKVTLHWQRPVDLNTSEKKSSESSSESNSAGSLTSERGSTGSTELSAPAEVDGALHNHAAEAERKRPSLSGNEDGEPKRPRMDSGVKNKVANVKVTFKESESKESCKSSFRSSTEVSVVDLVEDDIEQEKFVIKAAKNDGPAKGGEIQGGGDNKPGAMVRGKSDSSLSQVEKKGSLTVTPATPPQGPTSAQTSGSVTLPGISSEEKRTSLSSITGKNGLISQMQSIEVKKVKLCPQLEKQATAMSAMPMTPAVATPKPSASATLTQIPVSMSASTPETTEIPSLVSSKVLEIAQEVTKERESVLMGADLERKKGLNPVHSETRKMIQRLTRSQLESYFMEMTTEALFRKSEAGRFRQLYEEMKATAEMKANKIAQLNKQLSDLTVVVHKAINESKEKKDYIPQKIFRSVGLQLEQSQIFSAMKNRSKEEKGFVTPPSSLALSSHSSGPISDRSPSKHARPSMASTSRTTPTCTSNGLVGTVKDTSRVTPVTKSPQRQLKAIHPRPPMLAAPNLVQSPSSTSLPTPSQATPDICNKRPGFIDIADEKLNSAGTQIGIRRHRSPAVLAGNISTSSVNTTNPLSAISPSQVLSPPPLKVLPAHYMSSAAIPNSNQSGANARVVTAAAIPVTSISSPRLTYIIPANTPIQQRITQPSQLRGRTPPMPVLMRANNTIVTVPQGSIPPTPQSIRAVTPTAAQQVVSNAKISPQQQVATARILGMTNRILPSSSKHPAPLPAQPQPTVVDPSLKPIPRRPVLKLSKVLNGIVLSWNMTATTPHEEIASYQLFAYQEGANAPPSPLLWKKVGDVKALPLPMACTLTQFAEGHTYHFAVRAVDVHGRVGEFSVPGTIELFS